jgi:hypothetical protein
MLEDLFLYDLHTYFNCVREDFPYDLCEIEPYCTPVRLGFLN